MVFGKMARWSFLLVGILACTGCGDGSQLLDVSGAVSIDGKPAEKGSISFFPVDGQGPSTGAEIVAGKYSAKVPRGECKVEIRVPKIVGQKKLYDTPDSPFQPILEEVLSEKFNEKSELRFTGQPGKNDKNWDLKTG